MTDTRTNGELSDKQMEALNFAFADFLRVKGELDDERDQNAELRIKLAEAEAKLDGMNKLNDLYRDQLNMAITDRRLEMDRSAKYAALLSVLHTAMHEAALEDFVKPPENG